MKVHSVEFPLSPAEDAHAQYITEESAQEIRRKPINSVDYHQAQVCTVFCPAPSGYLAGLN